MAGADSGGTTLDMSDGLSESRVRCISQMPDGRMAVATTATIEVYDWTRFHTVKLLPEDACPLPAYHGDRQLTCDSLGYVWLRNDRTLYVIDTWQGKAVADVAGLMADRGLTPEAVAAWPAGRPGGGAEICRQIADGIAGAQADDDGPTADEQFMARLAKTIEEHMADEEFSVLALSRLMAMDRTVLYRRMQAATGMSPSAYIKSIRMGVARRLLKDTQLSLADIARRTGFHSVKYFSAAFKDSFGVTPSEYRGS